MLARKYDEYAWELEEQQENTVRQTAYVKRPKQRNLKLMRRRIAVVAGILLATYFACVVRSECLISKSNELVALKQQEAALMLENSEERIVVEQLKGPERITSIAEKQLGMQVARNNIYVKADKGKIAYGKIWYNNIKFYGRQPECIKAAVSLLEVSGWKRICRIC